MLSKWKRAIRKGHTSTRKADKRENPTKIFLKYPLRSIATKLENVGTKMFLQIYKILILTLWFVTPPCFLAKIAEMLQKVIVFLRKGRGDRALILTDLNSPMVEVFPCYCLSFSISTIFRGKRVVKVRPKVQILGPSLFHENSNPSNFFKNCFYLLEYYLWWEFGQYWTIFVGVRNQRAPKKGHFVNAESVRDSLKIFNLTNNHKCYSDET